MLYSYINNQKACRDTIRILKGSDGNLTTDTNAIVNILNEQFCLVFNPSTDRVTSSSQHKPYQILTQCEVNPDELFSEGNIIKVLVKINILKSVGPDGIHPLVLRNCKNSSK
jgi:hypothetical protein